MTRPLSPVEMQRVRRVDKHAAERLEVLELQHVRDYLLIEELRVALVREAKS